MSEVLRVLIVDDQALVRSGFELMLSIEDDIEVVGSAADGREALDLLESTGADIVLMDVEMPGMDGIEATARITSASRARVIIVTTFGREDYLFDALRAGASGFLLKNADPDDLVEAVRKVAGGHALLAPEMTLPVVSRLMAGDRMSAGNAAGSGALPARAGEGAPDGGHREGDDERILASLTRREREVLQMLAQGMSNGEIASELVLGEATIKTHVSNILAKTRSRDRVQAVVFAYRTGLAAGG